MYGVLRNYLNLTESFLDDRQESLEKAEIKYLKKRGYSLPEIQGRGVEINLDLLAVRYEANDDVEDYLGYPYNIRREFPNLLRSSLFITAYSIFEKNLHHMCRTRQETHKFNLSVTDLRGAGIVRSKDYLLKVAGINLSDTQKWQEIRAYSKLRNCITHNGRRLEGCKDARFLASYVANNPFLNLKGNEIQFFSDFCKKAIDDFEEYE